MNNKRVLPNGVNYMLLPAAADVNADIVKAPIHVNRLKSFKELPDKFKSDDVLYIFDEDLHLPITIANTAVETIKEPAFNS